MQTRLCLLTATGLFFVCGNAFAQSVTLQLPSIGRFTVNTTVVVPDRGRTFLGSISRAGESVKHFGGPLRFGSSKGLFREHSGMTSSVYIHDLEAMDRYLLNQAGGGRVGRYRSRGYSSLASLQRRGLIDRYRRMQSRDHSAELIRNKAAQLAKQQSKAERYFKLGMRALGRDKIRVAKVHFRNAAKSGSAEAKEKLAELEGEQ